MPWKNGVGLTPRENEQNACVGLSTPTIKPAANKLSIRGGVLCAIKSRRANDQLLGNFALGGLEELPVAGLPFSALQCLGQGAGGLTGSLFDCFQRLDDRNTGVAVFLERRLRGDDEQLKHFLGLGVKDEHGVDVCRAVLVFPFGIDDDEA